MNLESLNARAGSNPVVYPMKVADFQHFDPAKYMVKCSHGFYLTFANNYSGRGWGWVEDREFAAKFNKDDAAAVLLLSMEESSRWKDDYPVVVDEQDNFVPTTAEELENQKRPKSTSFTLDW